MKRATIRTLNEKLTHARRQYAAGNVEVARMYLKQFSEGAREVFEDQQKAMARDMGHHLRLREELAGLTREARAFADHVKS